ncbi:hypothetical protein [Mesorhizobium sp. 1M-11]|uniref:hypothetical protein n=1 Tax=Mesorhizobium sp. 1M-11 TaxID=1529006 RepID=UPI0013795D69|nr:hypothetical protein [Mesorhizobium sp. 1M-11]
MAGSMLEQFQEKCVAVFRSELRENKELERFRVSVKTETLQDEPSLTAGQATDE